MWQLALVQGPGVTVFGAGGSQRQNYGDFATAVATLLKDGWEPFGADSNNLVVVWFRKRIG